MNLNRFPTLYLRLRELLQEIRHLKNRQPTELSENWEDIYAEMKRRIEDEAPETEQTP